MYVAAACDTPHQQPAKSVLKIQIQKSFIGMKNIHCQSNKAVK